MQFIDLKSQLAQIRPNIDARIKSVLDHGQFIMGPEVFELEEKLSEYVGVKHCVSCANGTDALQLSLMALNIGPGDIVFTTAFSFFATAEVIPLVGATPYFVDIDKNTFNLCPLSLEKAIIEAKNHKKGACKAVIVADIFGLPADYDEIQRVCHRYDLHLIEDAAQSFGASIAGRRACSFGDIATTSFFPAKPLGCYGDGGAIFTNSDRLADLCRSLRLHGKGKHKYENVRLGMNSRLDTLQAAILLEKLTILETEIQARQVVAEQYTERLGSFFELQNIPLHYRSSWAQFSLYHPQISRNTMMERLKERGIASAIYYPIPLNKQDSMSHYPAQKSENTEAICAAIFSIPVSSYLTSNEKEQILSELLSVCDEHTESNKLSGV